MKLREYIKRIGKTGRDVAKELQVSAATVSRWQAGKVIPSREEMLKIVRWSHGEVSAIDFYTLTDDGVTHDGN